MSEEKRTPSEFDEAFEEIIDDPNQHTKGRGRAGAPSGKDDLMSPLWSIIDI